MEFFFQNRIQTTIIHSVVQKKKKIVSVQHGPICEESNFDYKIAKRVGEGVKQRGNYASLNGIVLNYNFLLLFG